LEKLKFNNKNNFINAKLGMIFPKNHL